MAVVPPPAAPGYRRRPSSRWTAWRRPSARAPTAAAPPGAAVAEGADDPPALGPTTVENAPADVGPPIGCVGDPRGTSGSTAAGGPTYRRRRRPPPIPGPSWPGDALADGSSPRLADVDPDLALLRAYEPVLRYTAGELFLPTSVGPYLARCSLWADDGGQPARAARRGARPGRGADAGRARRGRDPAPEPAAVPAVRPGAAHPGRGRGVAAGRPAAAARQGAVRRASACWRG